MHISFKKCKYGEKSSKDFWYDHLFIFCHVSFYEYSSHEYIFLAFSQLRLQYNNMSMLIQNSLYV